LLHSGSTGIKIVKLTKTKLKQIIKEEMHKFLHEDLEGARNAVRDYLFNLSEDDLIGIAADFLGEDPDDINYEYAMEWVEGLSTDEVEEIYTQMTGD